MKPERVEVSGNTVRVKVSVLNSGEQYAGESETVEIVADAKNLASYDPEKSAWVVEAGDYGIFVSEHAESKVLAGVLKVEQDCIIENVSRIVKNDLELKEIEAPQAIAEHLQKNGQQRQKKPI